MLTDTLKQEIQQAYRRLLKSKELKPRYGQRLMIAEIARTLGEIETDAEGKRQNKAGVAAIEAGTGTGKTVAYLLATLPIAKSLGKKVVISTATVTLQEQIVHRDLPDVLHHSGLDFRFALAKGRGRYVCLSKLDKKLQHDALQESLFEEEGFLPSSDSEQEVKIYDDFMKALLTKEWDGEKDSWRGDLDDDIWRNLTADRNECLGRRCQFVNQCAFMKARDYMGTADCIVANHDLVMADLALGGGAILPPPDETIYIFDEAHHLPEIALRHFTGNLRVNGSLNWAEQCIKQIQEINKQFGKLDDLLDKLAALPSMFLEVNQFYKQLKPLVENLLVDLQADAYDMQGKLPHYRFEHGLIPDQLALIASELVKSFQPLLDDLSDGHEIVGSLIEANQTAYSLAHLENLYSELGTMLNNAERQYGLWQAYSKEFNDLPDSRWIQLVQSGDYIDYELSASPLLAAEALHRYLWNSCFAAILTSATLTALGEFNRLRMQSGLPHYAKTAVVPSPFDYPNNARFVVPALQYEPNHPEHSQEVVDLLDELVTGHLGVLVLFSSRRQLEETYELLSADMQDNVLCQTHMSRTLLLDKHKKKIDKSQQSILFGLASLAEGVDLPGDYCTHVIIDKLPFAVPSDPVSAALDEWLKDKGRNAFVEMSLPEVSQKLVQACGRLIRNENDKGQITLLDKRILTKRYGKQLIDTLPPFKKILG